MIRKSQRPWRDLMIGTSLVAFAFGCRGRSAPLEGRASTATPTEMAKAEAAVDAILAPGLSSLGTVSHWRLEYGKDPWFLFRIEQLPRDTWTSEVITKLSLAEMRLSSAAEGSAVPSWTRASATSVSLTGTMWVSSPPDAQTLALWIVGDSCGKISIVGIRRSGVVKLPAEVYQVFQ